MEEKCKILCLLALVVFGLVACTPSSGNGGTDLYYKADDFTLPYDLSESDEKYRLPSKLVEISGLGAIPDGGIGCVSDESGTIYLFDPHAGEVKEKIEFGKDGDYEGIAFRDSTAFVLRSSGKIYEVKRFRSPEAETIKHKIGLDKANNPEGLTYDPVSGQLLISCRGLPDDPTSLNRIKSVFSFDPGTGELAAAPVFQFDIKTFYGLTGRTGMQSFFRKFNEFLNPGTASAPFHPSGVDIHPISGHLYIVSSNDNLLVVVDRDNRILMIRQLDSPLFKQPEGIAFLPNGDMLISNEGQGEVANILQFNYIEEI